MKRYLFLTLAVAGLFAGAGQLFTLPRTITLTKKTRSLRIPFPGVRRRRWCARARSSRCSKATQPPPAATTPFA